MWSILGRKLFKHSISSIDRFYPEKEEDNLSMSTTTSTGDSSDTTDPDFASVFACQRFFFSSPGSSNSIMDSSTISSGSSTEPYIEFRRSMEEMVEAGNLFDLKSKTNWECLHELLLCYLALNPKTTHNSILRAFSDLLHTLMMDSQS